MYRKGTLEVVRHSKQNNLNGGGSFTIRCTCGNEFRAYASRWKNYTGKGCGKCYRSRAFSGTSNPKFKHGGHMDNAAEYQSYQAMKRRCYDVKYRSHKWYGARGIKVCSRWLGEEGFSNFFADMGKRPSKNYTLDRINNDGNYEPNNCRWADQKTQIANSAASLTINIAGRIDTLSGHLSRNHVSKTTYYRRIAKGFTTEQAIVTPVNVSKSHS